MLTRTRWDSHIHLFDRGINGDTPLDDELRRYVQLRDEYGVDAALVVGYEGTQGHRGNNAYIRLLARKHPWIAPLRFVAYGSTVTELEKEFVGHSIYLNDWPIGTLAVDEVFHQLIDTSVSSSRPRPVISINATLDALDNHRDALGRLQNCTVMVSHLGLPGRPASDRSTARSLLRPLLEVAQDIDVVVKLSAVYATDPDPSGVGAAPYVQELLESLGSSRLVWGSDFSPVVSASSVEDGFVFRPAIAALFDTADVDAVMGGNLSRRLGDAGFRADGVEPAVVAD